jgi:hypothetical protein
MLYSLSYLCGPKIISNEFKNIFFVFKPGNPFHREEKKNLWKFLKKGERMEVANSEKAPEPVLYTPF